MNITYLLGRKPFTCTFTNRVEIFNEACVYASLLCTTTLTNAAVDMDFRNDSGWYLVGIAGLNILGNVAVVFLVTATDAYSGWCESRLAEHQREVLRKKLANRKLFERLMPGEFGDLEEIRKEYEAKVYCEGWLPYRRWLAKHGIKYA